MKRFIPAVLFLVGWGCLYAQDKKPTPPPTISATQAAPVTPVAPKKEVPAELTNGLAQYQALNSVIADMKHKAGIDALETELQTRAQELLQLAAKDGFHFDPSSGTFVADLLSIPTNDKGIDKAGPTAIPAVKK